MAETLTNLKARARRRADMENTNFIGDAELTQFINASRRELYDLLVATFADYFYTTQAFTISSGSSSYSMASTIYKVRALDWDRGGSGDGRYQEVARFNFAERNRQDRRSYRTMGRTIQIRPESLAPGNYVAHVVLYPVDLSVGGDAISADEDQFAEYIVIDAAIKMLVKEESDVSVLLAEKEAMKRHILSLGTRDIEGPETVADVMSWETGDTLPEPL